jgi:hypothetical protein
MAMFMVVDHLQIITARSIIIIIIIIATTTVITQLLR